MMVTGSIEIAVKNQAPYLHPGTWYWHVGFPTTSDPSRCASDAGGCLGTGGPRPGEALASASARPATWVVIRALQPARAETIQVLDAPNTPSGRASGSSTSLSARSTSGRRRSPSSPARRRISPAGPSAVANSRA